MSTAPPPPAFDPAHQPRTNGLAIAALVCGIVGICLGPLGLVGLILGIVALTQINKDPAQQGSGLAIGGIVTGAIGLLGGCLILPGILLPSLGQARAAARQLKDQTNMRSIAQALTLYSDQYGALPPPDADWQALLVQDGSIPQEMLVSPSNEDGLQDYFYVPAEKVTFDASQVLVYQRPGLHSGGSLVAFHDNSVHFLSHEEYAELLENLTLPDGTPWAPHEDPSQNPVHPAP